MPLLNIDDCNPLGKIKKDFYLKTGLTLAFYHEIKNENQTLHDLYDHHDLDLVDLQRIGDIWVEVNVIHQHFYETND